MITSQNRRFVQGGNYLTSVVFLTISVVVAFPARASPQNLSIAVLSATVLA